MQCAEVLRAQAYFDHEIDAVSACDIERHVEHCAECRELLRGLEALRTTMRRNLPHDTASPELRARIARALDAEDAAGAAPQARRRAWRTRPFWLGALAGIGGSAFAAAMTFVMLSAAVANSVLDNLAAAHLHSLQASRLIEVASSDHHTVKPWFAGRADVSPVVIDFAAQGYALVGGRVDVLEGQRSAVVVYRHGAHVINVFAWAVDGRSALAKDAARRGYHIACWGAADLQYCAVSDTGWGELGRLVQLLQQAAARDLRE